MMERQPAWRYALGALGALVAGILTIPVLSLLGAMWSSTGQTTGVGVALSLAVDVALLLLVGGLCAFLVRSWWSLLIVPLGYLIGWLAGVVIDALQPGHAFEGTPLDTLLFAVGIFLVAMLVPLLVGAALGTTLVRRRPRRQAALAS